MAQYLRSPTPSEAELLRQGKTWYGMWTCRYWEVQKNLPGPPIPTNEFTVNHKSIKSLLAEERLKNE